MQYYNKYSVAVQWNCFSSMQYQSEVERELLCEPLISVDACDTSDDLWCCVTPVMMCDWPYWILQAAIPDNNTWCGHNEVQGPEVLANLNWFNCGQVKVRVIDFCERVHTQTICDIFVWAGHKIKHNKGPFRLYTIIYSAMCAIVMISLCPPPP